MTGHTQKTNILAGPVSEMRMHLERLVNVLYPENGIEWFVDALPDYANSKSAGGLSVKGNTILDPAILNHGVTPVVSVSRGSNEGLKIQCGMLYMETNAVSGKRTQQFSLLSIAKTFGSADESWGIARALQAEMEMLFDFEQVSILPSLFAALPRSHQFLRQTDLRGSIQVRKIESATGWCVKVSHPALADTPIAVVRFDIEGAPKSSSAEWDRVKTEQSALLYAASWVFMLSRQKEVRPAISQDLADEMSKEVRCFPGGYGIAFAPQDFVANTVEFAAKPKPRRSESLGLG